MNAGGTFLKELSLSPDFVKWNRPTLLMPTLSIFFGIVIRMYYDDHPPPHFHAIYGEHEAKIGIETLELIDGKLPRRAFGLVVDWAELHQQEVPDNWVRGQEQDALFPIEPLE